MFIISMRDFVLGKYLQLWSKTKDYLSEALFKRFTLG